MPAADGCGGLRREPQLCGRGPPATAPCLQFSWLFYLPMAFFCPPDVYALHRGLNTVYQVGAVQWWDALHRDGQGM